MIARFWFEGCFSILVFSTIFSRVNLLEQISEEMLLTVCSLERDFVLRLLALRAGEGLLLRIARYSLKGCSKTLKNLLDGDLHCG
jgi:hypothetical protein